MPLAHALLHYRGVLKAVYLGDFLWNIDVRRELRKELLYLESVL